MHVVRFSSFSRQKERGGERDYDQQSERNGSLCGDVCVTSKIFEDSQRTEKLGLEVDKGIFGDSKKRHLQGSKVCQVCIW